MLGYDKIIIPASAFFSTYFEGIQGIFGFVPNYLERPFQAFAGAFLGGLFLSVAGGVSITSTLLQNLAKVGASAAVGSLVGGTVGGLLGFGNVPLAAAVGAGLGAYMAQ